MSAPIKYRKRPVVIESMMWDGGPEHAVDVINWILTGNHSARWREAVTELRAPNGELARMAEPEQIRINTLEGTMAATPGDFIIKGVQGEFYPCKPDIFAKTYERAE